MWFENQNWKMKYKAAIKSDVYIEIEGLKNHHYHPIGLCSEVQEYIFSDYSLHIFIDKWSLASSEEAESTLYTATSLLTIWYEFVI